MRDLRFLFKTHYAASRALIIGIDRYRNATPLSYAVSDAVAIRDLLVGSFKFPESHVVLLTDEAATRQNILQAFLQFGSDDVGLDDRLVVFFAGHGHTRSGIRGEVGYLVPHDADMANLATLLRWDELTRNADLIRAKHILFIMDACYGGLALVRTTGPGTTRFLKDMMLRTSRQVLTAGKADEVVADSGGPLPRHSVFTGHLIEALQGKASTNGVLTANAVMSYVYAKVANDKNSRQTPHCGHVDGDGDMILLVPDLGELEASETKDLDRLISVPSFDDGTEALASTPAKLRRAKALLAADSGSIELHDLLAAEVRRFLSLTSEDAFAPSGDFSQAELVSRLERYETAAADLAILLACVAHWGRSVHMATLQKSIARSGDRLDVNSGLTIWLALRWYPLLLELYCTGVAAVDAGRYDSLAAIFNTALPKSRYQQEPQTFVEAAADAVLELNRTDAMKQIPGHERHYTPLSEYLLKLLQPRLDEAFFLGKSYESAFDTFEVHFALVSADAYVARGQGAWGPIGRFGWKMRQSDSPLHRVLNEAEMQGHNWPPLKAGLFGGDLGRFKKVAEQFQQEVAGLRWR